MLEDTVCGERGLPFPPVAENTQLMLIPEENYQSYVVHHNPTCDLSFCTKGNTLAILGLTYAVGIE